MFLFKLFQNIISFFKSTANHLSTTPNSVYPLQGKKGRVILTLSRKHRLISSLGKLVIATNESGATAEFTSSFKPIPSAKRGRMSNILHEKQFWVLDLETLTFNNIETPLIIGSVAINKGSVQHTNIVSSTNLSDVNSSVTILINTLDFMVGKTNESVKNIYVFAHNGAKFDTKVLLPFITLLASNGTISIINVSADGISTLYEIKFSYNGKTFILRDSIKLLGASVANLRNIYLKETLNSKININIQIFQNWFKHNPNRLHLLNREGYIHNLGIRESDFINLKATSPIDYIRKYCIIDCVVVGLSLEKFSKALADKGFMVTLDKMLTISSLAIWVFTKYFYNTTFPIASIPAHTTLNKFIKNAYIGGRTEVLGSGIGISNVYHFDVPGIYAQCINLQLPYGNPVFISNISKPAEELFKTLHNNSIIAFLQATVTCPNDLWLPVLGNKLNGKLTFNTGTFTGTWTSFELELALRKGYNINIEKGYIFITRNVLRDYSITMTKIKDTARIENDSVTRAMAKLLRNSLYGKFAASYHDNTSKIVSEEELRFIESAYEIRSAYDIGNNFWLVTYDTKPLKDVNLSDPHRQLIKNNINKNKTSKATNVAISATITSHGRIILYKLWDDVVKKGGTLLYSDTDSVFAAFNEAPYNKKFRDFIWPIDLNGRDSFKRVLFIAPKIYYLESIRGVNKFAVKGIGNTNNYTYDEVLNIFINKEKLVFSNQVAFKNNLLNGVIKGVSVNNSLTKVYDIFNSVKRQWIWEGETLTTIPVEIKDSVKAISSPQNFKKIENKKIMLINLKDNFKWDQSVTTALHFGTQYISENNQIIIEIPITGDIILGLSHTIATAIANSNNIENDNVKRVIIILKDRVNNIHKTALHVRLENFTNFSIENLTAIVNEKILRRVIEYSEVFNPNTLLFKIDVNRPIIINPDNNIDYAYNLSTTSFASKARKLKNVEEQIRHLALQHEALKASFDLVERTNLSPQEYNTYKEWKLELNNTISNCLSKVGVFTEDIDTNSKEFRLLRSAVIRAFNKTFEETRRVTLHSLAEKIIDNLKSDRYNNNSVKQVLCLSWTILSELVINQTLSTYKMKTQDMKTKEASLFTSHTFFINPDKSFEAAKVMRNKFILSKVSLTPIVTERVEGFSTDIAYTLNKLNATPITLNIPYLKFLLTLEHTDVCKMLNLKLEEEKNSIGLTWIRTTLILTSLVKWYEANGQAHFYMKYIHDFRGRLYPQLTHVRHISHKFLRPLFITLDSPKFTHDMLIDMLNNGKTDNKALELWFSMVTKVPGMRRVNFKDPNSAYILIAILAISKNENVNWNNLARITEIIELRKEGSTIIPAPIEYDAKARVLQHAAAVSNNDKLLAMIGIIEKEGINKEDVYLKTSELLLEKLTQWLEDDTKAMNSESDTTSAILENIIKDLKALSNTQLRTLAKKPLITKAYNARHFSLIQYVKSDLKDNNLIWSTEMINIFIVALKRTLTDVIMKEIILMKQLQSLIKDTNVPYRWTISPVSDFTVNCDNPIKETSKVLLTSPLSGLKLHTTMNVLKPGQNQIKNRNRIFVNIIHSLDALHIALIIKSTKNHILPIHDAILVRMDADILEIQNNIDTTFKVIHDGNRVFKSIVEQLESQTGNVRGIEFNANRKHTSSNWVIA